MGGSAVEGARLGARVGAWVGVTLVVVGRVPGREAVVVMVCCSLLLCPVVGTNWRITTTTRITSRTARPM